jgi:hypothetical protein
MRVVFDAGVVFSGAGWQGEAHRCLLAMARRRVMAYATSETLQELRDLVRERGYKTKHPPGAIVNWYCERVNNRGRTTATCWLREGRVILRASRELMDRFSPGFFAANELESGKAGKHVGSDTNPKSEIRNPKEIRRSKRGEKFQTVVIVRLDLFCDSCFEFVSGFEFRGSKFLLERTGMSHRRFSRFPSFSLLASVERTDWFTPNIERRTSNAERRTPNVERRTSNAERRTPNVERRTSNAEHRTPNVERRTSNAERRTSNVERRTSNAERRTPNVERRTSNAERRTSNVQRPTSNVQRPTSNGQRRTGIVSRQDTDTDTDPDPEK